MLVIFQGLDKVHPIQWTELKKNIAQHLLQIATLGTRDI
jgi:hypothetical protein